MKIPRGVVHENPPVGGTYTRCCLTIPADLPLNDLFTCDPQRVTCTLRQAAELVVDSYDGESPFGWREPGPAGTSLEGTTC
jgi:hypothetical protein